MAPGHGQSYHFYRQCHSLSLSAVPRGLTRVHRLGQGAVSVSGQARIRVAELELEVCVPGDSTQLERTGASNTGPGWSKLGSALSPRPGLMHTVFSVGSFWRPRTRQPRHTKRARCTQSSAVTQHGTAATRARGLREQAPGRGPATTRPGSVVARILYPETRSLVAGPGDSRRGTAAFGYRAG